MFVFLVVYFVGWLVGSGIEWGLFFCVHLCVCLLFVCLFVVCSFVNFLDISSRHVNLQEFKFFGG